MDKSATTTWAIEEMMTRLVGVKPKSQAIAMGIQSLDKDMWEMAASQLVAGLKGDNYPLTEAVLRKILVEACGLPPDTAKQRAAAVFGK